MMWYWAGGGIHWWGWFLGSVVTLAFWAFVIFIIFSLIRSLGTRERHRPTNEDDPERVLARRFASGEIDEEEMRRRLEALRSHGLGRHS